MYYPRQSIPSPSYCYYLLVDITKDKFFVLFEHFTMQIKIPSLLEMVEHKLISDMTK